MVGSVQVISHCVKNIMFLKRAYCRQSLLMFGVTVNKKKYVILWPLLVGVVFLVSFNSSRGSENSGEAVF